MTGFIGYQGSGRHFGQPPAASQVRDARLLHIDRLVPGVFEAKHVLDVGCNAGAVDVQLALEFQAASVTGVDIDQQLVRRAQSHLSFCWSRSKPGNTPEADYFPASAILELGHRPYPPVRPAPSDNVHDRHSAAAAATPLSPFPHNVAFFCEDWALSASSSPSQGRYDVILALSVIKWIHLEHLDAGLRALFRKFASALNGGGYLILELQPWSSYEKAIHPRKAPHFASSLRKLTIRPEDFDSLLGEEGLNHVVTSLELPRSICIYQKPANVT
ncbi:MAG: hypothetical protein M1819_001139 [Sarea resinae]|nr:MAG: hypothetical protein M1819_001139 [Sarea resinae]